MIEKEFRKAMQYVSLSTDNANTYSDFLVKLILQIGSEIDVIIKYAISCILRFEKSSKRRKV
jgi:hypothetical protein